MLNWMKHKLGSRLPGEISITEKDTRTPVFITVIYNSWGEGSGDPLPWTEEPGRLPSMGLHRVGHD